MRKWSSGSRGGAEHAEGIHRVDLKKPNYSATSASSMKRPAEVKLCASRRPSWSSSASSEFVSEGAVAWTSSSPFYSR
jgi:hypothetical protein